MKYRIFLAGVIVLLDLLFLPKLVYNLNLLFQGHDMTEVIGNMKEFSVMFPWEILGKSYTMLYLLFQIPVVVAIILTIWQEQKGIKNKMKNGIGGPEAAGGGQFGTARWQDQKERDITNTVWKYEKESLPKAGLVMGADLENKKVWLVTEDEHSLIIGTTGSGKTRRNIYPTIWTLAKAGESMVATDPKGELYAATRSFLESMGYEVVMLDFRNPRETSHHWNPMKPVLDALKDDDHSKASESAWNIAHMIVHQTKRTGDPIWANGSESVIAALILYVATQAKKDSEKHLGSVFQLLVEYGQVKKREIDDGIFEEYVPLVELLEDLPPGNIAKLAFATAGMSPEKMRGSFFASVAADLRLFSDPAISYMTSFQDHNLNELGKRKTAVFLIIPDEVKTRHFLAALYVDQTYLQLVELANKKANQRIDIRTNFLLDEFGNMPKITDFDTKITVSRSRGVRYNLVVQGLDQLKEKYGETANTISGNCRVWLYLLTGDNQTAKVISEKLGTYTVATDGYSSTSRARDLSSSYSQNLSKRELLTPDEVMRFPDFEAIIIRQRQYPSRIPTPDISQYPITFKATERGNIAKRDMKFDVFDPFNSKWEPELKEDIEQKDIEIPLDTSIELTEIPVDFESTIEDIDISMDDVVDIDDVVEKKKFMDLV